jgi:hypothetical protein
MYTSPCLSSDLAGAPKTGPEAFSAKIRDRHRAKRPEDDANTRGLLRRSTVEYISGDTAGGEFLERVWEICSSCFRCVIQALDVDRAESWPDGEDCQEDEALPI